MASFDPSVISQIGANMPNIPAAQQAARSDALTMRNLLDENQLNQLKLGAAQSQAQREQQTRQILAGSDYTTPKGVTETAERLTRAGLGPEAMDFTRSAQSLEVGGAQARLSQFALMGAQNDLIGNAASGLLSQYQSLVQGGTSPALATMIMQPRYQDAIKGLSQQKLPDGSPALDQQHLKAIEANPTFNPQFIGTVAMNSAKARQALTAQMGLLKDQAQIEETHARTRAINEGRLVPVQDPTDPTRVIYVPSSQAAGKPVGKPGAVDLSPDAANLAADMGAHGVPFPSGLGFGQSMRAQILNRMAQQGATWQEVRQNGIGYYLTKQESQIIGRQYARVRTAEQAITQPGGFADQVLDASEAVDFPAFRTAARAKGFALDEIQDPQYQTLKTALLGLASEYAIVLARGGQNVSSQDAARQLFSGVSSFPAMKAKVAQAVKEMKTTEQAAYSTVSDITANPAGAAPQAGYTPAAASQAAPAPDYSSLWKQ